MLLTVRSFIMKRASLYILLFAIAAAPSVSRAVAPQHRHKTAAGTTHSSALVQGQQPVHPKTAKAAARRAHAPHAVAGVQPKAADDAYRKGYEAGLAAAHNGSAATRPAPAPEAAAKPEPAPPSAHTVSAKIPTVKPLRGSFASLERQNERLQSDGLSSIQNDKELKTRVDGKNLVPLPASANLKVSEIPEQRRYCRPWTAHFLVDLARDHEDAFHKPLEVSSAVRTVAYQKQLKRVNGNAAPAQGEVVSPHLTGAAIDIPKDGFSRQEVMWMRHRLLALQQSGKLDVEEEFQQSCFHITVYKTYLQTKGKPLPEVAQRKAEPLEARQPEAKRPEARQPAQKQADNRLQASNAAPVLPSAVKPQPHAAQPRVVATSANMAAASKTSDLKQANVQTGKVAPVPTAKPAPAPQKVASSAGSRTVLNRARNGRRNGTPQEALEVVVPGQ